MANELVTTYATVKPHTRKTISPYDLSTSDNPGTVISRPALRGSNYDEWSASICLVLKARKKFGFADGSIPKPSEDSDDYEDWCANNALVVSWIKLTIDESLCSTLSHSDDASSLWTQIQKRFEMKNRQRVQRLKTELAKLWTNLADYQQAKTIKDITREREEDKLHQFLMGIDDSLYGAVKFSLLSCTPLPSLDEAYNILIQDEESKSLARLHEDKTAGVSFAVQTHTRSLVSHLIHEEVPWSALCVGKTATSPRIASRRSGILRGGKSVRGINLVSRRLHLPGIQALVQNLTQRELIM